MMDTATAGCYMPRSASATAACFWQSCIATLTPFSAPIAPLRPPPMTAHYYDEILGSRSARYHDGGGAAFVAPMWGAARKCSTTMHRQNLAASGGLLPSATSFYRSIFGIGGSGSSSSAKSSAKNDIGSAQSLQKQPCRIAIIGGGIAGVTAANALGKRFAGDDSINAEIIVFEGDVEGGHRRVNFGNCEQPSWIAATARNANSLVPGAAMHVMSQRKTLLKIAKDTAREWCSERVESFQHWLQRHSSDYQITRNIDNFDIVPPYFALHLFRCVGPSATPEERATFVTFLKHFVTTSLFSGEAEANERGRYIQRLAQSNRYSFLEAVNGGEAGKALATKIGLGKGFLSLHRTSEGAIHAFNEGKLFGETSLIMPLEEATKLEPRISNLPIQDQLFAVHRIDDYTANSAVFVQDLIERIKDQGVEYRCGDVGMIEDISQVKKKEARTPLGSAANSSMLATASMERRPRFKVRTKDGAAHDFDYVVLAAGVNTPLFARRLSAGEYCPTYPLRGYSLTIYTNHTDERDGNGRLENGRSSNLLNVPVSIDDMYCSSVGVNQARMAGFGELVGYRDKAAGVPSLAPRVMARYASCLFPESDVAEDHALQCFRPMSPDDIPIVGEVRSRPGLYMHTGHGTLGWTLCLATSECLAQALHDNVRGNEAPATYSLPGDITVDRASLSPNRFI